MTRALRAARWLGIALGALVLLIAAVVGGLLFLSLPPAAQEVAIPGLSAPVTITIDGDGVPRIRAASERDAAAGLGFMHARDRMFQLDMMRRAASGRLSELAGARALPFDREMRVLGLRYRANADDAVLPAGDRAVLESYANGVNAWIAARGRFSAPEFVLLGAPEPWKSADTLLWARIMGLYLAGNWQRELARLSLSKQMPADRIAELWPAQVQTGPENVGSDPQAALAAERVLDTVSEMPRGDSNAWAVAGKLSATGRPLLAGDPHLLYMLPGIWYLARIERPDGVWAGATAAGVPGVVMGRNSDIAWAFTTTGADTQDVFIETPAGNGLYATPDGPKPFTVREERIHVRGQPDVVLTVRETRHGPLISDITPDPDGPLLAVAMASLAPDDTASSGFLALNRAHNVAEAGEAAAKITSPVQNMMVADRERIGLFTTGRVPLRRAGDGFAPVLGADGAHDWIGFASGRDLPVIVDPPDGLLVNANEPVAPPGFPVFIGRDAEGPWRADRIRALLAGSQRHTVNEFAQMQANSGSEYARQLLPMLRRVAVPDGPARNAARLLDDWGGTVSVDSPAPLIFNAWLSRFRETVLQRAGVPARSPAISPLGFVAWLLTGSSDTGAQAAWCGGPCDQALARALEEAVAELAARLGPDPAAWRWGQVHEAVFAHPVLRFLPLLGALTEGRIPLSGDTTTVNRQEALFGGFESVHGPAYRGVYDLADLDQSRFMTVPGQSGHPMRRLSRSFVRRWAAGETITLGPEVSGAEETPAIRLVPETDKSP